MLASLITFLNMGGYGYYIWGAFGLSAFVLITLIIQSLKFLASSETKLHSLKEKEKNNET
jgi:heme exporter protein CcmD